MIHRPIYCNTTALIVFVAILVVMVVFTAMVLSAVSERIDKENVDAAMANNFSKCSDEVFENQTEYYCNLQGSLAHCEVDQNATDKHLRGVAICVPVVVV